MNFWYINSLPGIISLLCKILMGYESKEISNLIHKVDGGEKVEADLGYFFREYPVSWGNFQIMKTIID
jgi:hypothetical protein